MGFDFEVRVIDVEEVFPAHLQREQITDYLVQLKADAHPPLADHELLITSDTLVWHRGQALGKPKDEAEAKRMLLQLSGDMHEVISAVCVRTSSEEHLLHAITRVYFAPLEEAVIDHYIHQYQPLDKAGAYGIQDWIGLVGIEKIEGSYSNVVGLPTQALIQLLWTLAR